MPTKAHPLVDPQIGPTADAHKHCAAETPAHGLAGPGDARFR